MLLEDMSLTKRGVLLSFPESSNAIVESESIWDGVVESALHCITIIKKKT